MFQHSLNLQGILFAYRQVSFSTLLLKVSLYGNLGCFSAPVWRPSKGCNAFVGANLPLLSSYQWSGVVHRPLIRCHVKQPGSGDDLDITLSLLLSTKPAVASKPPATVVFGLFTEDMNNIHGYLHVIQGHSETICETACDIL